MKLIMETPNLLDGYYEDELNEASGSTERNYYLEGICSTPETKNRNGRVYSRAIWEREVARYQDEIKTKSVNTLGEWQHPPRSTVDPMKAVIRITELGFRDDGNVWVKAKILNDNSEQTNKLKGLIKEGVKIGISTRGVGKVSSSGVVEQYKLITADLVDMPSDYNAMLNGVVEGHQIVEGIVQDKEFYIDEETGCIGECSLETPEADVNEKIFYGKAKIGKKIVTMPVVAKDNKEAENKFIKRVQLEQKNGHAPKGEIEDIIFESEDSIYKNEINESKINLDNIGKDKTFIDQLKNTGITFMIKSKDEIIFDKKDNKTVQALLKDNGYSSKAVTESEDSIYKNVDIFKEILEKRNADKMCDLSLDEKEAVLSEFIDSIYKNGVSESTEVTESENVYKKLLSSLKETYK
jgi:hypothetical protein